MNLSHAQGTPPPAAVGEALLLHALDQGVPLDRPSLGPSLET